jgi:hypothetical protein
MADLTSIFWKSTCTGFDGIVSIDEALSAHEE